MMLVVSSGGGTGDTVVGVPGEKAAVVIAGSLEITIGPDVIALDEGDAVQFDAETPHSFRNVGSREARVLWVISQTPVGSAHLVRRTTHRGIARLTIYGAAALLRIGPGSVPCARTTAPSPAWIAC